MAGIGTTIGGSIVKEFFLFNKVEAISLVWLVGSLVTDVMITCSLVWYLVSAMFFVIWQEAHLRGSIAQKPNGLLSHR